MKAYSLLFLRASTGLLISIWGLIKIISPQMSLAVSEKYYAGSVSSIELQTPMGLIQILFGIIIILGVFRKITYPAQAIFLGIGLLPIWQYILDPLGLYLLTPETRQVLFFPSLTVFAATLVIMAFKDDDVLSLDKLRQKTD